MSLTSTTPTAAAPRAPSTDGRRAGTSPLEGRAGQVRRVPSGVEVGDLVLVRIDEGIRRPLLVTAVATLDIPERSTPTVAEASSPSFRVSGTIFCEPEDHTRPAFRGWAAGGADPARITGRPDRLLPLGYGEHLVEGVGVGQWIRRPLRLPSTR